jgi:organic radical activating enzyme
LKVIVHEKADLDFAGRMAEAAAFSRNPGSIKLYLQPGWGNADGMQLAIEFVKNNPSWHLSLQTHKWLGIS